MSDGARWIVGAWTALGLACALVTADRANPPDMTRAQTLSPEVTAQDGTLAARLPVARTATGASGPRPAMSIPRYLAMLKAYEDSVSTAIGASIRSALVRAAFQFARAGHIVSAAARR